MKAVYLSIVLAPLLGSIVAGLFGKKIGRAGAHWVASSGVGIAFLLSLVVFKHHIVDAQPVFNETIYTWLVSESFRFEIGFMIDSLTTVMIMVVTFVSLMVHIYTVGYMADDPGYQRFFSYIALFTFAMLMLVMANNFLQLFFGWEAVGLVSYLLIGFWFNKPTAIHANMKAFLVNRVGDFGFVLGIGAILYYFNSLDYQHVFNMADSIKDEKMELFSGYQWSALTVICLLLFVGAMGKSAQVPLHVWLPDSMEGPTPISALIHAATMVTAGVFMVARMSPLFELSTTALSTVLVIGGITALFMGFLGIIQNDIKRVVAYSTLSQLGYMMVGLGASAYAAGVFHLVTHAFFKALLFLAAGSVIIAMHHVQDIRKMGGLKKYMPITYWTALIGSLALIGAPGFAGFFSKDAIISAVSHAPLPGAQFAYYCVLSGVFVTAFYTFRMFFLVFHGKERMDEHTRSHLKESPAVVTVPLILLAVPSVVIGAWTIDGFLFGDGLRQSFALVGPNPLAEFQHEFHSWWQFTLHGFTAPPFILAAIGVGSAWYIYLHQPSLADAVAKRFRFIYKILEQKYGFDYFNEKILAAGARLFGKLCWRVGDELIIDGTMVNGSANSIGLIALVVRHLQTGYLYHYAFAMIIGLIAMIWWFVPIW